MLAKKLAGWGYSYILVIGIDVEACRHIFEGTVAVITATAAVGRVAGCIVLTGPGCINRYRVRVGEDDVGTGAVLVEVKIATIEAERDWMPWVNGLDQIIGDLSSIQVVYLAVGLVAGIVQ